MVHLKDLFFSSPSLRLERTPSSQLFPKGENGQNPEEENGGGGGGGDQVESELLELFRPQNQTIPPIVMSSDDEGSHHLGGSRRSRPQNIPGQRRRRPPPPPPAGLRLKKGRRSRRRYENEHELALGKHLDDITEEDIFETPLAESRSHFRTLLDPENQDWLELYLLEKIDQLILEENATTTTTKGEEGKENKGKMEEEQTNDELLENSDEIEFNPEEALNNSPELKMLLHRHQISLDILKGVERQILDYFLSESCTETLVMPGLNNYERLLAHACSSYNSLRSKSFGPEDSRVLKIENPTTPDFMPSSPTLTDYLKSKEAIY